MSERTHLNQILPISMLISKGHSGLDVSIPILNVFGCPGKIVVAWN